MRVLIDRSGLQAQAHLAGQPRLSTFLRGLESVHSCSVVFSTGRDLAGGDLDRCDVLVVTTRYPEQCDYSPEELQAIMDMVLRGSGLLLMSNHGDWPGHNPHDMTRFDSRLAGIFGAHLESTWFETQPPGTLTELSGPDLLRTHPIIVGGAGEEPVRSVVTNNCSSVLDTVGDQIVKLAGSMVDVRNGHHNAGRSFAVAIDADQSLGAFSNGRVVVMGDSGFIGTENTDLPGPGLIEEGDNLRFIRNVVRWLGKELR